MGGITDLLFAELRDAREQARALVQIRVTQDAIRGTVVATPIAPERRRRLAAKNIEGAGLVADPEGERLLELPLHPDDWCDVLCSPRLHELDSSVQSVRPTHLFGIPVEHES